MRYLLTLSIIQIGFAVAVSSATQSNPVIAEVGETKIRLSDLESFGENLPEVYKVEEPGAEADSLLLESLIDKTVLLLQARAMGIDKEPWFEPTISRSERKRLLILHAQREINAKVVATEQEILEQYRQTQRDRALRYAGILSATREEALEVLAELEGGADFADLARQRSLHEESRDQGGDNAQYLTKDAISKEIREDVFRLEVGELSEPVSLGYRGAIHYAIFKILDEVPLPVSESEDMLRGEVFARKQQERVVTVSDSLMEAYAPQIQFEVVSDLLQSTTPSTPVDSTAVAGIDPSAVIVDYRRGQLTVGDLQSMAPQGQRFADSTSFVSYLRDRVIVDRLRLEEAHAAELHQDPSIVSAVEAERQDLLMSTVRDREVVEQVSVSPEEARGYYDDHPELFQTLDEMEVIEVLVDFPQLARQLKQELEQGADPEKLATTHSIREGPAHHGGRLKLGTVTHYPDVYEAAKDLDVGAIGGPVQIKDGYSVFVVLNRKPPELKPYHDFSKRRATAFVKMQKRSRAYKDYVRRLRTEFGVTVFWDELRTIHGS